MKNRKILVSIVIASILAIAFVNLLKRDLWEVNADLLKEELLSIEESVETVSLTDITPFQWDAVYSFAPYTTKETIYDTVGYKWDDIIETVNEGMNQIVFLKDEKVVCYLYGYPENNGYGIYYTSEHASGAGSVAVLSSEDDLTFQVERKDHVIYLESN